jgi:DNA-3-methyladenine glycosylase II
LHLKKAGSTTLQALSPYDFELTVHKPAGWWWSTPDEKYENGTLWTALRFNGALIGLKLRSSGTPRKPAVECTYFAYHKLTSKEQQGLTSMLHRALRTDEDLTDFYAMAQNDDILRQTAQDFRGMHTVAWPELFPALILAVTLQMAPMKRSNQMMDLLIRGFGENAVFDGKNVAYWPSTKKIAATLPKELQEKAKLGYRAKNLVAIAAALEAWVSHNG